MSRLTKRGEAHEFLNKLDGKPTVEGSQYRLKAHEELLRYGAPGCGDGALLRIMAEALADICNVLADVPIKKWDSRTDAWDRDPGNW